MHSRVSRQAEGEAVKPLPPQPVEKLRHASQKCKHFFEGMQAAARTRFRSHTCGLGSVFSDVHAAGKHDLTLFRRLRTAELCEAFVV